MKKLVILLVIMISFISLRAQNKTKLSGPNELAGLVSLEFKLQHSKADCMIVLSCQDAVANTKAMNGETVQMSNVRPKIILSDCQGKAAGDFKTVRPKQPQIVETLRAVLQSNGPFLIDFKDQRLSMVIDLSKTK